MAEPDPVPTRSPGGVYGALVRRPVAAIMAFSAAVVFGLVSYANLPLNLMPDLDYPTLTVRTEFAGAAPGEVETQVSRPLEETLSTVPGLVTLESISRAGISDVVLEFNWDTDMSDVSQAVRERLGLIELPDEVKRPLVLRYDPNLDPILRIALSGGEGDTEKDLVLLRRLADEEVRRALEILPGVAAVKVRGGLEREVMVSVDEGLLHARGFTLQTLIDRLRSENINLAGGSLLEGQTEYLLRTLNEFAGPDEIRELVLVGVDGGVARLGDLATVDVRTKEREVVGRVGGEEAVEIAVYREADANIVAVSDRIMDRTFGSEEQQAWVAQQKKEKAEAAEAAAKGEGAEKKKPEPKKKKTGGKKGKKGAGKGGGRGGGGGPKAVERAMTRYLEHELPAGTKFTVVSDQARFIEASVSDVRSTALWGALLAVLVLFLFLRHGWTTAIIAAAIPISVVVTFAPMYLVGVSLNLMSLGGLALAIGMLVDNSIVVLESVHRCREEGDSPFQAAVRGTREVAGAVTASTLTTVAVFFPIAFVSGVAGQLFGHLALTVVFGLLASLAVAMFLIPVLSALPERTRVTSEEPQDSPWIWLHPALPFRQALASGRALVEWTKGGRLKPLRALLTLCLLPLLLVRLVVSALVVLGLWLGFRVAWLAGRLFGLLWGGLAWLLAIPGRPIGRLFDAGFGGIEAGYVAALRGSLRSPSLVLLPAAVLFAGSLTLMGGLGSELLPEVHQGVVLAQVRLPVGTPLETTMHVVDALEARIGRLDAVDSVYTASGAERDLSASGDRGQHTADMTIRLVPSADLAAAEGGALIAIRRLVAEVPDAALELSRPALFSFRTPLEVEVRGHELPLLRKAADAAVVALLEVPGLRDVRSNLRAGFPEIQIRYDRERLSRYGLDIGQVARAVRDKVAGNVATDLRGRARRTDVRVVLRERDRESLDDLRRLNVNPRGIPAIALEAVADLVLAEGPSEIRRADQERAALVTASLQGFDLGSAAASVEAVLNALDVDETVSFEVGGQSREMEASLSSLRFALLLAIFLVYVIMASQFESVVQPLVILFALPLALVGVAGGLLLTSTPVSVVVLIGAIVLAGVVVNNAIVLVDYANQLQLRGLSPVEAVLQAGRVRLRPIIISTLTTVLGLLPMAFGGGEGSEIRQPLALTIIAGLSSSTLLTLFVVPVLYGLLARLRRSPA